MAKKLREIAADADCKPQYQCVLVWQPLQAVADRAGRLQQPSKPVRYRFRLDAGEASLAGVITAGAFRSARPQR